MHWGGMWQMLHPDQANTAYGNGVSPPSAGCAPEWCNAFSIAREPPTVRGGCAPCPDKSPCGQMCHNEAFLARFAINFNRLGALIKLCVAIRSRRRFGRYTLGLDLGRLGGFSFRLPVDKVISAVEGGTSPISAMKVCQVFSVLPDFSCNIQLRHMPCAP